MQSARIIVRWAVACLEQAASMGSEKVTRKSQTDPRRYLINRFFWKEWVFVRLLEPLTGRRMETQRLRPGFERIMKAWNK